MYEELVQLSVFPQELGEFDICRALRLWRDPFGNHCLYRQVTSYCFAKAAKRDPGASQKILGDTRLDMDEITSGVPKIHVQGTETAQSAPDQTGENDSEDKGSKLGTSEQRPDLGYLRERIKYAEEQCGVKESLKSSSLFSLTHSLKICRLMSWLEFQLRLFETDKAREGHLVNFE